MVAQSGGGGGGGTYSYAGSSQPATSDETRLLLQYFADHGGSAQSYPSAVSAALMPAVQRGWLDDGFAEPRAIPFGSGSGGGGGVTTFRLTECGREELNRLTAASSNPTRLVYGRGNIRGVGLTAYGPPTEQAIGMPYRIIDGALIRD